MLTIMLHRVLPKLDERDYYYRRGTVISQHKFITLLSEAQKRNFMIGISASNDYQPTLCITFDDGYSDNSWAFDYLLDKNMSAWLFPVKDYIQQRFSVLDDIAAQINHSPDLFDTIANHRIRHICRRLNANRYRQLRKQFFGIEKDLCNGALFLTEQQIINYAKCGIKLGVHGTTHRIWSNLTQQVLEKELTTASQWLKRLTNDTTGTVCFPHGKEPKDSIMESMLKSHTCFGVDREYSSNRIVRRHWFKEDTDVENLLDEYEDSL